MDSWTRVIIEWANCLGIVDSTIDSPQDLQDGVFYERLVFQLCRGNDDNLTPTTARTLDETESVSNFIQAEYPDFVSVDRSAGISDEIYTASLLLVQCSQQPIFHRPMCVALKHETQIKIKRFLEMVLPCGKNLTRETLEAAIVELADSTSREVSTTPRIRPLKEFFNSPAVRSARTQRFMNDRNRELMRLRAQLETEQYEKADLLEDLKTQNDKMSILQKKLAEKKRELRELRNDKLRPTTPQSCRKKRPSENEERYKREIGNLETINGELGLEIEKLRDERDELSRRLTSNDNLHATLREKFEQSEKNAESLGINLELKNKELLELRTNCDELREHIRQMKRMSMGEQSFADIEPICDEALSSIVDIQLQEARKESAQLKAELSELKNHLESVLNDCNELRKLEIVLDDKTRELDELRSCLRAFEERLLTSDEKSANLEDENSRLIENTTKLEEIIKSKCEFLRIAEKARDELKSDLDLANSRKRELEACLDDEKSRIIELRSRISFAQTGIADLRIMLSTSEEKLLELEKHKERLELNLNEKIRELRDSEILLNNERSVVDELKAIVASYEEESRDLKRSLESSREKLLQVVESKKVLEGCLDESEKKIIETEESLKIEKAQANELKSNLIEFNEKIENLENLLESNETLLKHERSRIVELETLISLNERNTEVLNGTLEELKISLEKEKTGNNELRMIVDRSRKTIDELESLLKNKQQLYEESTKREKSLENDLEICQGRLKNLEFSLNDETSKFNELETQLILMKTNIADLEAKLATKERALEETEIGKKSLESNLQEVNSKMLKIQSNVETLTTKLSIAEEEKQRCILTSEKLEAYAREADEKIVSVEIKISAYERRIKELDESSIENKKIHEKLEIEMNEKNSLVVSLTESLEEMKKREIEMIDIGSAREKKIAELTELGEEMESQITQEREKSTILREQIVKFKSELRQLEENLQKETEVSEKLRKIIENLETTNAELDEKLKNEKNQLTILRNEKIVLNEELASRVNSDEIMRQEIDQLKTEITKTAENLHNKIDENLKLDKSLHESRVLCDKLHKELFDECERVKTLEIAKKRLNDELSSLSRGKADMTDEIISLHKELEGSRHDLQNLREISEKECEQLRNRIIELSDESKYRGDKIEYLENKMERASLEKERLNEKFQESINNVGSLEKRLLVAENSLEKARLEEKLKEESLLVVRGKYEQLGKEKIEAELRMKEVILNLQEVRTSQDQVLDAQAKAIAEKSRQIVEIEREREDLKNSLASMNVKLESEKNKIKENQHDYDELRLKNENNTRLVEELRESLNAERLEIQETKKIGESMKLKIAEIDELSKILKIELHELWDSVRNVCPELARPKKEIYGDVDSTNRVLASFAEDAKTIRKIISILSEANETLKDHLDAEKENAKITEERANDEHLKLDERINEMKEELEKRNISLKILAKRKNDVRELLSRAINERNRVDDELTSLRGKWRKLNAEARCILTTGSSACDELKNLRVRSNELDDTLAMFNDRRTRNTKNLLKIFCRILVWSEMKLQEAHSESSVSEKDEFSPETELSEEIHEDEIMMKDLVDVVKKIDEFTNLLDSYEANLKSGVLKSAASREEKLQAQLEQATKERKDLKDKLEAVRIRNAKMEKNMDELRNVNKKLKQEIAESTTNEDRAEIEKLRELTKILENERDELSKRINDEKDVNARLETVHNEYGQKLEKIKQKMKTAYNEQIAKLNQEQEKAIRDKMNTLKVQMEQQCRKYTEDIAKYKAHISDLSSRYWDVGEKLLAETQEKQAAIQQIQRLKGQHQQETIAEVNEQITQSRHKTASLDRREFGNDRSTKDSTVRSGFRAVEVIEEETTTFSTRRHSVKSIQAMGNAFNAEDEEGELFDSVYLADLKEGRCATDGPDYDRLTQLRIRNSMCKPHLKSSYAVETHLQPVALNEDDIKNGVTGDDVFNDSLSQSLLPGQKPKKKDRTQTSYKRPGPPTPSKNGGRLSLQGNELKSPSSRILKERNTERRTTATPRGLKNLFGTSISKRQDENTASTPKGRRLSNIFRKQRTERN